MNLSLGKFFKKEKEETPSPAAVAAPLEKPASERFSKTVMPSGSRAFEEAARPVSAPQPAAGRPISLGAPPAPTVAAEKTVALALADLLPQIPAELLQKTEVDPEQQLVFRAAELERGIANGRPAVRLRAIYQQVPGIFNGEVSAEDEREVALPLHQLLQQFGGPQVQQGLGRSEGAPPPIAAPKLPALAPIRLSMPQVKDAVVVAPLTPKISPNGTGAPATERVPASSGSPVPTPLPAPFAPMPAGRVSFKMTPAASDLRAPLLPSLKPISLGQNGGTAFSTDGPRIQLSLRSILRGVPPFQFSGVLEEIPESAQIEVPVAVVMPQLSLGRVAISPAQFQSAMPEEFRPLFKIDEGGIPVSLPLPEVLQNLPNDSLRLRGDQEVPEVSEVFETPFSQKAAEDAVRLKVPARPIAPVEPTEESLAPSVSASICPERTALQAALETDETPLEAKSVVAHVSRLPGVSACAIVFTDGLSLAGDIPADYGAEALSAIAPEMIKRFSDRMSGANFGTLQSVTLFCAKAPVSFFACGNIYLAALHSGGEITAEIRARLGRITEGLAEIYTEPEATPNA